MIAVIAHFADAAEPSSNYLRDWLICGPIQLNGAVPGFDDIYHMQGFEEDYLAEQGGEAVARPQAGQTVTVPGGEIVWKSWHTDSESVDLDEAIDKIDGKLAYAYTEFESDAAQAAIMALGTDDGCRVWLNGEQIFDYPSGRALVLDADLVPVLLQEGTNRLLIKVEDQFDGWGVACRFLPLGEGLEWKRLRLFDTSQQKGRGLTLDFAPAVSLLDTLVTSAKVQIARNDDTREVVWSGPWERVQHMPLPLNTEIYGEYILSVDAVLAGNRSAIFERAFTVGTPIDHTLFSSGASSYVILISDASSESERWAAVELQKALAEISGVALPIATPEDAGDRPAIILGWNGRSAELVGGTKPTDDDESFFYKSFEGDIVILGGSQRGTMYGVMSFLENEFGVRFYTPAVTVMPKHEAFTFRLLSHSEKPGIRVRNVFYYEAFHPIWAARNRSNGAMGTRVQPGGVEGYWSVHTFYPLLPPEEFFATKPEWYSLIDGKRSHDRAQLCLTNPEVLDKLTERLKERMRENPDNLIYCVSQNDWHGACECDNCQAIATAEESEAGPVVWFVNQVAERVKDEFPDKYIGTLAYQYTRKPPKTIKPLDNVVIRFCSIECCFAHDFLTCPQNVSFVEDMKGWARIAKNVYIWDYVVNFSNYVMPFPNFAVLQSNIQTLRDHNAIGIMEQAAYQSRGGDFSELKAYLISKLLWNPEAEVEPIIDDFMYGFYGRSGQYIRDYFDLAQSLVSEDTHFDIWIPATNELFNENFVKEAGKIFDQAERVADNPEVLARVELTRLPLLFLKCKRTPRDAIRDGSFDRLLEIINRENVTHFAEAGKPHLDAFLAEMEALR
jgi:hypothetical protein